MLPATMSGGRALVVLSGGQDSTTCLHWALRQFDHVEAVTFDYGQRHRVELSAARHIASQAGVRHHLLPINTFAALGGNALTDASITPETGVRTGDDSQLPNTFVPGRNLLFLTLAAALAYRRDLQVIVTGVCETDFSGYPDCRDDTMKAMQLALSLGMDKRFLIDTPLMWIDKADTWQLARDLGGDPLVNLIIEHTHTCYQGDRTHRHAWGYGCGTCPACELRARGFERYVARAVG